MTRIAFLGTAPERIRALVADHVGVGEDELRPGLSLVDELALDSLDLADLAATLEEEFGVSIPEITLDSVRTYADLVDHVLRAMAAARIPHRTTDAQTPRVVARLSRPTDTARPLEWSGEMTPYLAQTLAEHARRLGPGARLEVAVTSPASAHSVQRVRERLVGLADHGIEVLVTPVSSSAPAGP